MKKFSSLIIALSVCIAGFAQNARTVSGIVTESDGTPVVAAMVIEKGTMNGASTDIDGKYSIRVSDKDIVLEISCIGFETLEVPVSGTQAIANATLKQDNILIDDAIVIGYGVQNRRDVTTSIVSMKAEDMTNKTNADFREMMAAKMPGVQVLQLGGRPAGNVSVRIRGIQSATSGNDPLYVIDGIPTESSVFSQLDASDIESIEVLKDASAAAIYGSRGSCGVILITTKRGNSEQPRINYDGYYGIAQVSKKIDLLDAWEFATMFKEARNGSYLYSVPTGSIGDPNSVRPEVYNRIPGVVETYLKDTGHTLTNTDWQDAIFRNAQTTRHAVSVSGKAGSANYYIGANYLYREGTIICSDYQRYSIRANIDGKKGRLKYGISVNPSYSAENYVDSDSQYGSDGVIASALMAPPIFPVKNADGSYNWDMNGYLRKNLGDGVGDTQTNEVLNPVALANEVKDFREKMNILGNAYASFEIIDGLEYRITAGGDYYGYARDYYRPSTIPLKGNKYIELDSDPTMPAIPVLSQPKSRNWSYHYYHWTVSNQLSFNRKWGDHSLRAVAAYEAEKKANRTASIYGDGTIGDDKIKTTKGTTLDIDNTLNNLTNYTFDSWLVRAQYSYKARYMLSASIRGDRSSRFGSNNRLGIFPAASIGWRISDEDFMRDVKAVSDLKLRASVGQTGNANIGNYEWLALYGISNIYMGEGNSIVNQVYPSQIQNADLGWERNTQYNIGVDANLWSGLLGFSVDAYYSRTTDMLFDVPVPAASGFTSSNVNIGSMENKGIEISLNSRKTFPSGFFYEARGNWTLNRNKVLSLGDEDAPIIKNSSYSGAAYITQVGQPVGCYYLLVQDGVFHNQEELDSYPHFETTQIGDFRFIDADGDGILEKDDDRVIVGNYMPDFYYGFGLSMGFKGIDLSADFQGVYGNEILNLERRYLCNIEASSNMMDLSLQRFPYGEINRATRKSTGNNGSCTSTFHIEDGSYLRLQNLALGYTLPKSILRRAKINNLRIYLQGSNLFTLTNYTGYNPEVNKNSSDALRPGEDYCSYPLPRTYTVGVNLNF